MTSRVCVESLPVSAPALYAAVELPLLISDHMIIQRQEPIRVWGRCEADTDVELELAGEKVSARSDSEGAFHAVFNLREAGGPYELKIRCGADTRTVLDILIGDVWLCSGQSNMEWILRNTQNAEAEIGNSKNSRIRHFQVPKSWAIAPSDRLAGGSWEVAGPEAAGDFTAVGYYFAKRIQSETGIPIGLLHASWGGSNIESWMSPAALGETDDAALDRMKRLMADADLKAESIKKKLSRWPGALVTGNPLERAKADWSATEVDEEDWLEISAPGLWEAQGLEGVDGVIWYRKTFRLNGRQAAGGIVLNLARIDDSDVTWVNGHKVGETGVYDQVRRYEVPAQFLKRGENRIAIRVEDTGGGGGIYSDAGLLHVETSDGGKIPLTGEWRIRADKVAVSMMTDANHTPTALYNKMIHPVLPFPIKGILWYQGESNADTMEQALLYDRQFRNLILDWRRGWSKPELAFYWVQLANFRTGRDTAHSSPWATLREAQTTALKLENTGQAITIDVGDPNDIHPRDKKTVGTRLALIALNKTYGRNEIGYSGPLYDTFTIQGSEVVLYFDQAGPDPAAAGGGNAVSGFEIAGEDGNFKPAAATIRGRNVVVSCDGVDKPAAVRYAWKDNPGEANLVGSNGLPAGPFRVFIGN